MTRTYGARRPAQARVTGPRPNKYDAGCVSCGHIVPAGTGILTGSRAAGWSVTHSPRRLVSHFPQEVKYAGGCEDAADLPVWEAPAPRVNYGFHNTGNARGRCEDAPCCGCCD